MGERVHETRRTYLFVKTKAPPQLQPPLPFEQLQQEKEGKWKALYR